MRLSVKEVSESAKKGGKETSVYQRSLGLSRLATPVSGKHGPQSLIGLNGGAAPRVREARRTAR